MRKPALFLLISITLLATGCAGKKAHFDGPFGLNTHETFLREGTGETALYLENEPWCTLIDLHGFRDVDLPRENPDEFLLKKNSRGIFVRACAMKIDEATTEETCRKSLYKKLYNRKNSEVYLKTISGRKVMSTIYEGRKQLDYTPFYKGYCFDIQFVMDAKIADKEIERVLKSIVFVDDPALKSKFKRLFHIYDKKVQLAMPDTWNYEFKAGLQYTPAITFTPVSGDAFSMHLAPIAGFEKGSSITREQVLELFKEKKEKWQERNAEDPPIIELINDRDNLYITYFDVKDLRFTPGDEGEYPYHRLGYAMMGKAAFSFIMMYTDEGRAEVERAITLLEHMKIMEPNAATVIEVVNPGK